jgi:hypothetical protein
MCCHAAPNFQANKLTAQVIPLVPVLSDLIAFKPNAAGVI